MAERDLSVYHVTIWRWVQRYAPILNQRIRRELHRPNRCWRVDETYVRVAGSWAYLYRAVDSAGETIDFMLSPKREMRGVQRLAPPRGRDARPLNDILSGNQPFKPFFGCCGGVDGRGRSYRLRADAKRVATVRANG